MILDLTMIIARGTTFLRRKVSIRIVQILEMMANCLVVIKFTRDILAQGLGRVQQKKQKEQEDTPVKILKHHPR